MIVPDVNLLLYTYDASSPFHAKAARWWRESLTTSETVGLPPVVIFGFVRISTNPRIFSNPLTPIEAIGHVRSWLARPVVQILEPQVNHVEQVFGLLETLGVAGNLITDAQIAACAMEHGAVLHTTDTDFLRFTGLRWFNPINGTSSGEFTRGKKQ